MITYHFLFPVLMKKALIHLDALGNKCLEFCNTVYSSCRCVYLDNSKSVKSLWYSDAIWQRRSGSTLSQVISYCLMAPSHYLNQDSLIINEVLWHSPGGIFIPMLDMTLKHSNVRLQPYLPGTNELSRMHVVSQLQNCINYCFIIKYVLTWPKCTTTLNINKCMHTSCPS